MIVTVNGASAHAATGGVEPSGTDPIVVLVHGAGMDSTAWQLQTRYLAHRGFRPFAVDLPGHGRSEGPPLTTIVDMADWLADFILALGAALGPSSNDASTAHIVGHSMGTFIGLEVAARRPDLVRSLVLMGTADAMPVHPELLRTAAEDLPQAAALMAAWGHDKPAHVGLNPTPGMWMLGGARALVENSAPGALAGDFGACAAYQDATTTAAKVTCPVAVAVGLGDKMTPPRAAAKLIEQLDDPTVVHLADTGHSMMTENPRAIRKLLVDCLKG